MIGKKSLLATAVVLAVIGFAGLAPGSERVQSLKTPEVPPKGVAAGRVTGLPVPRFVSLKASRASLRTGPGEKWAIKWEYRQRDLPLLVVDEYDHWRKVRDMDGTEGWLHKNLVTSKRTAQASAPLLTVRRAPDLHAAPAAVLEKNVIMQLNGCNTQWCNVRGAKFEGWVPRNVVWGVAAYEGNG